MVTEVSNLPGVSRHRFTVEEYHRLADAGILGPDSRTELIHGEIVHMPPIGSEHAGSVNRLTEDLVLAFAGKAIVSVQNPVRIRPHSEPQPDFLLLRTRVDGYGSSLPEPESVLLAIEISDSSLSYDRGTKLPLYAQAGIPEVWIVDLRGEQVEIHRNPGPAGYRDTHRALRGEHISPAAFPDCKLSADRMLG